jgi:hypothetical protein
MKHGIYERLQETAHRIALTQPHPAFYQRHAEIIRRVDGLLGTDGLIRRCRAFLDESQLECAHGLCHCETVARDAGALVLIEAPAAGIGYGCAERLAITAALAGLLHDIKRKEQDHALRGSVEAGKILAGIGMDDRERGRITAAIKNHEAFKESFTPEDREARLVSDALYDADKFRWGPENFTVTLWLILEDRNTPPEALHRTFREKMDGIAKIKDTFRTETGRRYGPEIIDQGIVIGNAIYEEMSALLR